MNIYESFFSELNQAKIKYLVVGGLAVNFYGYMRVTADIDIILSLDEKNLEKMDGLMNKLGYSSRLPVDVKELSNKKQLKEWILTKNFKAYTYLPAGKKFLGLEVDIVIEESLKFDAIYKKKVVKKMNQTSIPMVGFEALVGMKKRAGREKDIQDLKVLFDIHNQ